MKKRIYVVSMLAAFLLAGGTVRAQSIDDKIKSLEQELIQLKEQQIEIKKEATSAAAAMPTFEYRPGNGFSITAADKSWEFRSQLETHFRYYFVSGRDQVGRSNGEMEGRRFRWQNFFCIMNCLWEADVSLDLDGFGGNSLFQRAAVYFHAENLHPWLPTVHFGMDTGNASPNGLSRQGSGTTGAQAEYDLLSRNNAFNTGSAGQGIKINWDDRSLESIGIPGRIGRFEVGMAGFGEGADGNQTNTDRKDFNVYLSLYPMSQVKNKWLSGLVFEYGHWFCNVDKRASANACARYRLRDHSAAGQQTLFDSGNNTIGKGTHHGSGPGMVYSVGPYTLRAMMHFERSDDGKAGGTNQLLTNLRGKKLGQNFLIGHDLYLWSPSGFLTGSAATPGSVLVGTHFERNDMSVGCGFGSGFVCPAGQLSQFHRTTVMLREWDLWYVIASRMNIGVNILWYDASNLTNGVNGVAHNLGVCKTPVNSSNCRSGIGGDWVDVFLNWRYTF